MTFRLDSTESAPFVKERLYDLCADGVARKIWDFIEVISPEGEKGFKGVPRDRSKNYCHLLHGNRKPVRQVSSCKENWKEAKLIYYKL